MASAPVPSGFRRLHGFTVPDSFTPAPNTAESREVVYSSIINTARAFMRFQKLDITVEGAENYPTETGAMIVVNHTGYFDFVYSGVPAFLNGGRLVRFMAKQEIFDDKVAGPLMRGCKHIPVDRFNGAGALDEAIRRLRNGALVGIFPEATISRSFELKEFKSGAARIAKEAGVPLIPVTIFGSQRVWTKGQPKHLGRWPVPVWLRVGEAVMPSDDANETNDRLHAVMTEQLDQLKKDYEDRYGPFAGGEPWLPKSMGGSAPTLEVADAEDVEEREAKRIAREKKLAENESGGSGKHRKKGPLASNAGKIGIAAGVAGLAALLIKRKK